jgi:hypothetical protein
MTTSEIGFIAGVAVLLLLLAVFVWALSPNGRAWLAQRAEDYEVRDKMSREAVSREGDSRPWWWK